MGKLNRRVGEMRDSLRALYRIIRLNSSSNYPELEAELCDAMYKRFECCVDQVWKFLRYYLQTHMKVTSKLPSAFAVINEAARVDLISYEQAEELFDMLESRNEIAHSIAHSYDEPLAEEMRKRIPEYYMLIDSIVTPKIKELSSTQA